MLCLGLAWERSSGVLGASLLLPPALSVPMSFPPAHPDCLESLVIEISLLVSELNFPPLIQSGITSPFNLGNERLAAERTAPD